MKLASITSKITPVFKNDAINAEIILFDFNKLFLSCPIFSINFKTICWSKNVEITKATDIPGLKIYLEAS